MKHSQQRLLFQAATNEQTSRITDHVAAIVTLQKHRFRPCGWIAVVLALLFFGCASLTPERIAVLTAIATQAAQIGAQQWLAKHPEQRPAFQAVIDAINDALRVGDVTKAIAMLHSLPVTSLSSKDGEVYWTGEPRATNAVTEVATVGTIVIWDPELAKAVRVTGAAEKPVVMAVRDGLRRAVAPLPPVLPVGPVRRRSPVVEPALRIVPEGAVTNTTIYLPGYTHLSTSQPTNELVVAKPGAPMSTGRTNITRSVLDVQTHAGSVPVVTVRWRQAPGGIYHVQQRESELATNWWTFATVTNSGGVGSTNWSVSWPPNVQVGSWRVLRVR